MAISSYTNEGKIDLTYPANGDLSSDQYKAFKLDANERADLCDTGNEKVFGVLQNAPDALDEQAILRIAGVTLLKVSEAVSPGKFLTVTSAGLGEVCDAANEEFFAVALADGVANDVIPVLLQHGEVTATDA